MAIPAIKLHGQALAAALQFLTRIPIPIEVPFEKRVLARSVVYFPIAGFAVGLGLSLFGWFIGLFVPPLPAAVLLLTIWTMLSGGLHLDGWMDTADGVLSHRSRERMLEIMKDSRVGAMGVIAAVLLLLFKFAVLVELLQLENPLPFLSMLTVVPIWSRWWMSVAIAGWPSARQGEGIGALFQEVTYKQVAAGFACTIILTLICCLIGGFTAVEMIALIAGGILLTIIVGWWMATWLSRKLGGLTGDTYGALNEGIEALLLLASLIALN
ncbi:MAG: adenosylcobinamide-GDP ribazoletransferase [Candidatus Pristimantibacillus sp.]